MSALQLPSHRRRCPRRRAARPLPPGWCLPANAAAYCRECGEELDYDCRPGARHAVKRTCIRCGLVNTIYPAKGAGAPRVRLGG